MIYCVLLLAVVTMSLTERSRIGVCPFGVKIRVFGVKADGGTVGNAVDPSNSPSCGTLLTLNSTI